MYKAITSLGAIAALAATATAHGITTGVTIDGVETTGFKLDFYYAKQNNGPIPEHIGWYAENLDNGFVEPNAFGTADIICHKNASPEGSKDTLAKVAAGGTVEFHWNTWPESHVGPVITYVAPYTGDIASVKKEDLKWTKIQANGYENGEWAAIKMIKQNNTWPVTVPENLAAGKYVFRHEIIALHSAGSANGAQAYPQCLNIEVTGSGTTKPEGVAGTSLYKVDEDGIIFNAYGTNLKYNIPGPPMFGSGSGSAPSTPTTPSTPSKAPSAAPSKAPSAAPSAAPVENTPSKPSASPAPVATPTPGGNSGALPKEFTIETFISWLESKASSKARRHARSFA
jgi:cellulase